jgi:hypothetical protein
LVNIPKAFFVTHRHGFHGRRATSKIGGIYAQEFSGLVGSQPLGAYGYTKNNRNNNPSICNVTVAANGVNGIGVDTLGNLVVPDAFDGIYVFQGPTTCGTEIADIPDSLGQAADGAAIDATTGNIVIGHANGVVGVCTVTSNACTELTTPNNGGSFMQVAMDKSGNCYADGVDSSDAYGLWYYASCAGTGTEITSGFSEPNDGGIDIDNKGDLAVLAQGEPSTLTVYSGCSTGTCTVVSGPTNLDGAGDNDCVYGRLGRENLRYACGDYTLGQIDVYSYKGRTPSYLYSFNNGLTQADIVEAAAYSPSSQKK